MIIIQIIVILCIDFSSSIDFDDLEENSFILFGLINPPRVNLDIYLKKDDRKYKKRNESQVSHLRCCLNRYLKKACSSRSDGSFYVDGAAMVEQIQYKDGNLSEDTDNEKRLRLFYDRSFVDLNVRTIRENRLSIVHYTGPKRLCWLDQRSVAGNYLNGLIYSTEWLNHTINSIQDLDDDLSINKDKPETWIKTAFEWNRTTYLFMNSRCFQIEDVINITTVPNDTMKLDCDRRFENNLRDRAYLRSKCMEEDYPLKSRNTEISHVKCPHFLENRTKNIISIEVFEEKDIQEVHVYYTDNQKGSVESRNGIFSYSFDVLKIKSNKTISNETHTVKNGRLTEVAVYKSDQDLERHYGFYFTNDGLACHFEKPFNSTNKTIEITENRLPCLAIQSIFGCPQPFCWNADVDDVLSILDEDLHIIFRDYFKYFLKDKELLSLPSLENAVLENDVVSYTPQYPMQIDAIFLTDWNNHHEYIYIFKDNLALIYGQRRKLNTRSTELFAPLEVDVASVFSSLTLDKNLIDTAWYLKNETLLLFSSGKVYSFFGERNKDYTFLMQNAMPNPWFNGPINTISDLFPGVPDEVDGIMQKRGLKKESGNQVYGHRGYILKGNFFWSFAEDELNQKKQVLAQYVWKNLYDDHDCKSNSHDVKERSFHYAKAHNFSILTTTMVPVKLDTTYPSSSSISNAPDDVVDDPTKWLTIASIVFMIFSIGLLAGSFLFGTKKEIVYFKYKTKKVKQTEMVKQKPKEKKKSKDLKIQSIRSDFVN